MKDAANAYNGIPLVSFPTDTRQCDPSESEFRITGAREAVVKSVLSIKALAIGAVFLAVGSVFWLVPFQDRMAAPVGSVVFAAIGAWMLWEYGRKALRKRSLVVSVKDGLVCFCIDNERNLAISGEKVDILFGYDASEFENGQWIYHGKSELHVGPSICGAVVVMHPDGREFLFIENGGSPNVNKLQDWLRGIVPTLASSLSPPSK